MLKVTIDGDPQQKEYVLIEAKIGFRMVKSLIHLSLFMKGAKRYEELKDEGMAVTKC